MNNEKELELIKDTSKTVDEVVKLTGRSYAYIYGRRKKLGIRYSRKIELNKEHEKILLNDLLNNDQVAKKLNDMGLIISASTVADRRRELRLVKNATVEDRDKIYVANGNIRKCVYNSIMNSDIPNSEIAKKYNISNMTVLLLRQKYLLDNTYDSSIDFNNRDTVRLLLNAGLKNREVAEKLSMPSPTITPIRRKLGIRFLGNPFSCDNYKYVADFDKDIFEVAKLTGLSGQTVRIARRKILKHEEELNWEVLLSKYTDEFFDEIYSRNNLSSEGGIERLSIKYDIPEKTIKYLLKKIRKNIPKNVINIIEKLNKCIPIYKIAKEEKITTDEIDDIIEENSDLIDTNKVAIVRSLELKKYTSKELAVMFNCRVSEISYIVKLSGIKPISGYSPKVQYNKEIIHEIFNESKDIRMVAEKHKVTLEYTSTLLRQENARRIYNFRYGNIKDE